jgi:hypothetical protein
MELLQKQAVTEDCWLFIARMIWAIVGGFWQKIPCRIQNMPHMDSRL